MYSKIKFVNLQRNRHVYLYLPEGEWVLHLLLQGIDNGEKWEPMEVRVAGTNPADAMLTHEHCNVQIVEYVSAYIRYCR